MKMPPLAVIDIGTNSALLLVTRRKGGDFVSLHEEACSPRLGEGLSKTRRISSVAVGRLIRVLKRYRYVSETLGAEKIIAVGTRVFRAADNTQRVVERVARHTGLQISVLSAKQEAGFALRGALSGLPRVQSGILVDVGGGSTEFVLFRQRKIVHSMSFAVGAVVLAETILRRFCHISERRLAAADREIARHFSRLPREYRQAGGGVVGVGGTITTLAAMERQLTDYDAQRVHGVKLSRRQIERRRRDFREMTIPAIQRQIPFDPARARVLPAGTFLWAAVLKQLGREHVRVSHRGLRWGVAEEFCSI